jgi:BASS family bile acid:Na+ symporter
VDLRQLTLLALQVSIVGSVFGYGLRTTVAEIGYLVRRPGLLARSLLAMWVIMPIIAVALVRFFAFRHVTEVALVAVALSPVPPLLPKKEIKAGGVAAYGLGLMAWMALLAIVAIPLAMVLLARFFEQPLGIAPAAVARIALITVLVPLAGGMIVRASSPATAERIAPAVSRFAQLLLALGAIALLAGVWPEVWAALGDGTVVAIVVLVIVGFAVGHLLGGPEPEQSVVLGFSSACRHPAIALTLASTNFPDEHFGGTILLYLIVNVLVGIPYLRWNKHRATA